MKHLRYTLLATTVLVCADLAAAAPASAAFCVESPVRTGTAEVVKPTPGEKAALKQREVFVKERFIELFGAEVIEGLGLNWETLRDASVSFEHPDKRHAIHKIKDFLRRQSRIHGDNEVFESIYAGVLRLSESIFAVHLTRLEDHARIYFQTRFPGATVKFSPKLDGVQLGSIARVNHEEGKVEKFYIKTHSSGFASERSSTPGSVNPIELLVYQLLETFGVGSKTHFFGRDERNFYIATKDASAEGNFEEYSKVDRKNRETTAPVWGALSGILVEGDRENEDNAGDVERVIATDPLAQSFIHQMSLLDALARLMVYTDPYCQDH